MGGESARVGEAHGGARRDVEPLVHLVVPEVVEWLEVRPDGHVADDEERAMLRSAALHAENGLHALDVEDGDVVV